MRCHYNETALSARILRWGTAWQEWHDGGLKGSLYPPIPTYFLGGLMPIQLSGTLLYPKISAS